DWVVGLRDWIDQSSNPITLSNQFSNPITRSPDYQITRCYWLDVLRAGTDGTGDWIGGGTVSVRLYWPSVALNACAFVMAPFSSATAFGSCAFTSLYARMVCSPITMPPI